MELTDISVPDYFHKVVDCQWACPAHTPVPEYIRLIAAGRYSDAYMINWVSNVFPGILGRTCDRPCEPACRRVRVDKEPVAICQLKRVAADFKDDIRGRLPQPASQKNGKRVALIGAGPASLTVARDLAPLGYEVVIFDQDPHAGGMMRTQIPKFRLPDLVLDEEVGYVLGLGIELRGGVRIDSLAGLLAERYDAVFIGSGAPRGRNLDLPGRQEAAANIHIGIDWLSSVSFGHTQRIGKRVLVLGGGNTAMDCCRSSRRLGGEDVTVVVRSGFEEMKASPWEKEDAMHEGIPILNYRVPRKFTHDRGRLTGVVFEKVRAERDGSGRRQLVPTTEPDEHVPCDDVLIAVGQETPSRLSSGISASSSIGSGCPALTRPRCSPRDLGCFLGAMRPSALKTSSGPSRTGTTRPFRSITSAEASPLPTDRLRRPASLARRWAFTSGAMTMTCPSINATACRCATRNSPCATSKPRLSLATTPSWRWPRRSAV